MLNVRPLTGSTSAVGSIFTGRVVARNTTTGVYWLKLASEKNHPDAQFLLGVAYAAGEGVSKDPSEAVRWWRKAAEQNEGAAQFGLGLTYSEPGGEVPQDFAEAFSRLLKNSIAQ